MAMADEPPAYIYQATYHYLETLINQAPPGTRQKLPSLRDLAQRLGISISTAQAAYSMLEAQGRIYCVARSGYYADVPAAAPLAGPCQDLLERVHEAASGWGMRVLSHNDPTVWLSLESELLKAERDLARQHPGLKATVPHPFGEPDLRRTLAARYTSSPQRFWCAEDVYVGADLRAVLEILFTVMCLKGKAVLVFTPCSWLLLDLLAAAGARVVVMPLHVNGEVDLGLLEHLLVSENVTAALLCSALCAPQGTVLPAAQKLQVAALLQRHGTWLVENDVHGEYCFEPTPRLRNLVDPERLVVFGSLDKVIGAEAPYGYLLSRHWRAELERVFLQRAFRLPPTRQKAVARLYRNGRVDAHLNCANLSMQQRLACAQLRLEQALAQLVECRMPQGGATLWLRSRYPVNMRGVFERLVKQRIVIAPGDIFSRQGQHPHCLRISAAAADDEALFAELCAALANALAAERLA